EYKKLGRPVFGRLSRIGGGVLGGAASPCADWPGEDGVNCEHTPVNAAATSQEHAHSGGSRQRGKTDAGRNRSEDSGVERSRSASGQRLAKNHGFGCASQYSEVAGGPRKESIEVHPGCGTPRIFGALGGKRSNRGDGVRRCSGCKTGARPGDPVCAARLVGK